MKKRYAWIALAVGLMLALGGCTRNSEAKVTVHNTGELGIKVTIYYSTSTIPVGGSDTFTVTWPGRKTLHLNMASYPVGQTSRIENTDLALNNGDDINLDVAFEKL
jgi:hypothetical protein